MSAPDVKPPILIVAGNASARSGGESILPLHYFTHLAARGWPVTLIAHERNREELCAHLPDLVDQMRFTADTALQRLAWRLGRHFPGAIEEHVFGNLIELGNSLQLRRLVRAEIRAGRAALVHQPVPVSPAAPSTLFGLEVPVVIGPMNGGMNYPPGYASRFERPLARTLVPLGRRMAALVNRLLPGKPQAAMLLVANQRTARALPIRHARVVELVENGVDMRLWRGAAPLPNPDGGFRLVFLGRLIALKGLDYTLQALARARAARPDLDIRLDILGDGPERAPLTVLTEQLGLAEAVRFHGFLPQAECARHLAGAQALILNSLRECGGAVVLEAMALGKPVIAADWGGPADYVDESCGLLVAPSPPEGFETRLAEAMLRLAANPEAAAELGRNGAERVRLHYDWARKIERIEALYAEVLASDVNRRGLEHRAQRE